MAVALSFSEFIRSFVMRSKSLSWLNGAGISFSAGIPTAGDMTWEFKRAIYCSETQRTIASCSPLTDPALRARIQSYFDSKRDFPSEGTDAEYSFYFETAYPSERDRRSYIQSATDRGKCSYGHMALAALMSNAHTRAIFTTNFDSLIEDAQARVAGRTSSLVVVKLEDSDLAQQAVRESRFPLLVKLHGDFRSTSLKNTSQELREQDSRLRKVLVDECRSHGLVVAGYSGRDGSIMAALREALDEGHGFPNGLFWLNKGEGVNPAVTQLLDEAHRLGVEARLIEVDTFDETMSDLLNAFPSISQDEFAVASPRATKVNPAPFPGYSSSLPIIRTNALPVVSMPVQCRLVDCEIGGTKQVREAIAKVDVNVIGVRTERGVIAFGSDADIRKAFEPFGIKSMDVHTLNARGPGRHSSEVGLLSDALIKSIARQMPVKVVRRRDYALLVITEDGVKDERFANLDKHVRPLRGRAEGLEWAEALRVQVEFRFDKAWLLIEPTVWMDSTESLETRYKKSAWINARLKGRYNSVTLELMKSWIGAIFSQQREGSFSAVGCSDGFDATFKLRSNTGWSGRQ